MPSPAEACPSPVGQLSDVHVELGDLVGPRLTMQASFSTDRKLLIGVSKQKLETIKKKIMMSLVCLMLKGHCR